MDYEKLLLEFFSRVQALEIQVKELKQEVQDLRERKDETCEKEQVDVKPRRDKTRYIYRNSIFLKNHLVLCIVTEYVKQHPNITCEQLKETFDRSLQGSYGVVEDAERVKVYQNSEQRFFMEPEEVIHLVDGDMYVCSQWGKMNISRFIAQAERLGFKIQTLEV